MHKCCFTGCICVHALRYVALNTTNLRRLNTKAEPWTGKHLQACHLCRLIRNGTQQSIKISLNTTTPDDQSKLFFCKILPCRAFNLLWAAISSFSPVEITWIYGSVHLASLQEPGALDVKSQIKITKLTSSQTLHRDVLVFLTMRQWWLYFLDTKAEVWGVTFPPVNRSAVFLPPRSWHSPAPLCCDWLSVLQGDWSVQAVKLMPVAHRWEIILPVDLHTQ